MWNGSHESGRKQLQKRASSTCLGSSHVFTMTVCEEVMAWSKVICRSGEESQTISLPERLICRRDNQKKKDENVNQLQLHLIFL